MTADVRAATWRTARTLADLGECTARWLEGTLETHPGYHGRPDAETAEITRALTILNRHGLLTTGSQPGLVDRHGRQRAFLDALCDRATAEYLAYALEGTDLIGVIAGPGRRRHRVCHVPVSKSVDGQTFTSWGTLESSREHAAVFAAGGVTRPAVREIRKAWRISAVDPQWGRGDLLWDTLVGALSAPRPGVDMLPVGYTADGALHEVSIGRTRPPAPQVGTIPLGKSASIALTGPKLDTLSAEAFARLSGATATAPDPQAVPPLLLVHEPDHDPDVPAARHRAVGAAAALRIYVDAWWRGGPMPFITDTNLRRLAPAWLVNLLLRRHDAQAACDLLDLLEYRPQPDTAPCTPPYEALGYRWARLIGMRDIPYDLIAQMRERYGEQVAAGICADADLAWKGLVS